MLPFELTKDTPYLALSGELWSVFYEYFNRNWPCYKGFLLYILSVLQSRCRVCWCSGDFRGQCISRHCIDPHSQEIPSPASAVKMTLPQPSCISGILSGDQDYQTVYFVYPVLIFGCPILLSDIIKLHVFTKFASKSNMIKMTSQSHIDIYMSLIWKIN